MITRSFRLEIDVVVGGAAQYLIGGPHATKGTPIINGTRVSDSRNLRSIYGRCRRGICDV